MELFIILLVNGTSEKSNSTNIFYFFFTWIEAVGKTANNDGIRTLA